MKALFVTLFTLFLLGCTAGTPLVPIGQEAPAPQVEEAQEIEEPEEEKVPETKLITSTDATQITTEIPEGCYFDKVFRVEERTGVTFYVVDFMLDEDKIVFSLDTRNPTTIDEIKAADIGLCYHEGYLDYFDRDFKTFRIS